MVETSRSWKTLPWVIAAAVVTSPLFFFFEQRNEPEVGRAAWMCALVFVVVVKIRWELRTHSWFWLTLAGLAALHVPLILLIPWTASWIPAFGIWPVAVLDCAIILGCIALVERAVTRAPTT